MKRRIKKDNQRREVLNIPVPESELVEVAESDTEVKDAEEGKAATTKDEKTKEERAKSSERHSHRDDRSPERRRTPPRRRPSPPRYRGSVSSPFAVLSLVGPRIRVLVNLISFMD